MISKSFKWFYSNFLENYIPPKTTECYIPYSRGPVYFIINQSVYVGSVVSSNFHGFRRHKLNKRTKFSFGRSEIGEDFDTDRYKWGVALFGGGVISVALSRKLGTHNVLFRRSKGVYAKYSSITALHKFISLRHQILLQHSTPPHAYEWIHYIKAFSMYNLLLRESFRFTPLLLIKWESLEYYNYIIRVLIAFHLSVRKYFPRRKLGCNLFASRQISI